MIYKELKIFVLLKKDILVSSCGEVLGKFISSAMNKDKALIDLHNTNTYKYYVYDNLYPVAKEGVYLAHNMYTFRLHTVDVELAKRLLNVLNGYSNSMIKVIGIEQNEYKQRHIDKIYSLTPIIVTLPKDNDGKVDFNDLTNIQDIVINQLVYKYSKFTGDYIELEDARAMFTCFNTVSSPICMNYKGIKLTGVKVEAEVAPDTLSQNLAFFALGCGLGEKGAAIGSGFTIMSTKGGR